MYDDILLPTDGSEATETVIEHALEIAGRRDATIHVLHVVDDRAFLTLDEERIPAVTDEFHAEGEQALDYAVTKVESAELDAKGELRQGNPADEIVTYADENDIDLVVMGTHGADPRRNLLGSVSQKVVTLSRHPVLVVDISAEE
ncbi:universal stress protein [Haladaptatus sp. NG-SE-30]